MISDMYKALNDIGLEDIDSLFREMFSDDKDCAKVTHRNDHFKGYMIKKRDDVVTEQGVVYDLRLFNEVKKGYFELDTRKRDVDVYSILMLHEMADSPSEGTNDDDLLKHLYPFDMSKALVHMSINEYPVLKIENVNEIYEKYYVAKSPKIDATIPSDFKDTTPSIYKILTPGT